jgi:serpin B
MRPARSSFAGLAACAVALACSRAPRSPGDPPGTAVGSARGRIPGAAPAEDVAAVAASGADLGFDLYRKLANGSRESFVFSPQSIALGLALPYAGASGATREAFERVLHVRIPEHRFHRALGEIALRVTDREEVAQSATGRRSQVAIVNQLFAREGLGFERGFLARVAESYGAEVRLLDFAGAPDASREAINRWVEKVTAARVRDVLPQGSITAGTVATLANTVYLKAPWSTEFDPDRTRPRDFHLLDGSRVSCDMMEKHQMRARAAQVDGVELLELTFLGRNLSMLVMMPPREEFARFEEGLGSERLRSYVDALRPEMLTVLMPRFQVRTAVPLERVLGDLGLAPAFATSGDFSRMRKGDPPFRLSRVVHEAFLKVNEEGAEAAAFTGGMVVFGGAVEERMVVLDHPFLVVIRNAATGAVVFLGRLLRPG